MSLSNGRHRTESGARASEFIPGAELLEHFTIYNGWGKAIFTINKIGNGWDRRLNGINIPLANISGFVELEIIQED